MLKTVLLLLCCGLFHGNEDSGELRVRVQGADDVNGKVMMSLCSSKDDFKDDHAGVYHHFEMRNGYAELVLTDLPPDYYGIKLFVDLNGNDEMDYNLVGIPKEPYGFSNNAFGLVTQPGFDEASFKVQPGKTSVQTIDLRGD